MTDLESEIDTLRTLDSLRVDSGRLRDEGKNALIALLEQENTTEETTLGSLLFCVDDIKDTPSLINKLQHDANPKTRVLSAFVWGQVPQATRALLSDSTLPLSQRESALIQELNRILQGVSIYESARFTGVHLHPDTLNALNADNPTGKRLIRLNRLLLEEAYPLDIERQRRLDILTQILPMSVALWDLESAPPENVTDELTRRLKDLELKELFDAQMPIPIAADVMHALVEAPGSSFTQSFLYCYYLIVRELYTADSPDWAVGGVRASPNGGMVSAYVTRHCVRAVLSLIHALENTASFIAKVSAVSKEVERLGKFSFPELNQWVLEETKRLRQDLHTTTLLSPRRLVFEPPDPADPVLINETIEKYIGAVASRLKTTIENVRDIFEEARKHIADFRSTEHNRSRSAEERTKYNRAEAGHLIADSAVEQGYENAKELLTLLTPVVEWDRLENNFRNISEQVRGLLHPAKNFLSSALDRELTVAAGGSGSYGEWDVVEMACAAAAHGAVTGEWGSDRLHRVVDFLNKVISNSGRFPIGRPYHRDDHGGYAMPYHTDVIEPLAQIFKEIGVRALRMKQPTPVPIEPLLVTKMLTFFRETRADLPIAHEKTTENGEKKGWCLDYMSSPCPTDPNVTLSAVQSLALINRMLDEQINARILYHFSVKQPDKLETDLHTLYYPDYGISQAAPQKLHRDSVATSLQKMRAHVGGLRDPDTLYSIVLHGPQGTGKTTIAEALASSCEAALVEVTPSDIVLGGGEAVERRARTVFEALSFLTRVVILFDEFDPVVWKREPEGGRPSDVFSFLTASMLPKLKTLHKTAKIRSVAYILITNLIGSLDEATIRKGRFDETVGIYPPDVLSRAGRFVNEAAVVMERVIAEDPSIKLPIDGARDRLEHVLKMSRGGGMQDLNRKGYFTRPDEKEHLKEHLEGLTPTPLTLTPLYYYIWGGDVNRKPEQLVPDAHLRDLKKTTGRVAVLEYQQWGWVHNWDDKFDTKGLQALTAPDAAPPEEAPSPGRAEQIIDAHKKLYELLGLPMGEGLSRPQ